MSGGSEPGNDPSWWKEAVFYQIYPWSFCLADPAGRQARLGAEQLAVDAGEAWQARLGAEQLARGAGDLEGVRRHLDYLVWLGVDAIWLSPFYVSPMRDLGYDVADHCAVDPIFGTIEDFDRLMGEAHDRGLRLIVDLVPNHTSDQHPWFVESRSSRDSPRRHWYVWRDPDGENPGRPPNNWKRAFGKGPAWTFDEGSGQWYLHLFLPEQPDLNWSNPEVAEAFEEIMAFWLDLGVDGFRIDVVHALGKDPSLPDAPVDRADVPWSAQNDDERTHPILRRIRSYLDSFPHHPVSVGEVFLLRTETVAKYYGDDDELHLAFNFTPMFCEFEAECFRRRVSEAERFLGGDRWPTWVLSSHDRPRHRTRYGSSERRARAAAVLVLGMRGTPFLYAGEELGLEDAPVQPRDAVDPGGRDGCRAPIPWDATPAHGWNLPAGTKPWLPFPPEADVRNVASLTEDSGSVLHLYRTLLTLRRQEPSLRSGSAVVLESPDNLLVVARGARGENELVVVVNFHDGPAEWADSGATVLVSSSGEGSLCRPGTPYDGRLGPEEAVILARREGWLGERAGSVSRLAR